MSKRPAFAPLTRRRGRRVLLGAGIAAVVAGSGAVGAALWGTFIRSERAVPSGPPTPVPLNAVATQPTDRQLWAETGCAAGRAGTGGATGAGGDPAQ